MTFSKINLVRMLVTLLIVLGVVVVVAPYFVTEEDIKEPLIAKLEAATGRRFTIDGDLSLRLFPSASVSMQQVAISNMEGLPQDKPFMTLDSMKISMKLLPLMAQRIMIDELTLNNPHINLHVTREGVNNWGLPKAVTAAEPAPAKNDKKNKKAEKPKPSDILVSDLSIRNGSINYTNVMTGKKWDIKALDSDITLDGIAAPFTASGSGEWNGKTVAVDATFNSLQTFFDGKRTSLSGSLKSDLLVMETNGFIDKAAYYAGKLTAASPSVKSLMAWADPDGKPTNTPAVLAFDLKGDAECSSAYCTLNNIDMSLDQLKAKGSLRVEYGTPRTKIVLALGTNVLDFNAFLPQKQARNGNWLIKDAHAADDWNKEPFNLSGLKNFDASAEIKSEGVRLRNLSMGKTTLRAKLMRGRLDAEIVDALMYSGKGNATVGIDTTMTVPVVESNITLSGVQLEPLLKDINDSHRFSGAADVQMSLYTRGASEYEMINDLAGRGQGKVTKGVLRGINIADMVKNVATSFKPDSGQKTEFSDMSGSFLISQGVLTNKDLVLTAPTLNVGGSGSVNLPKQTISYRLTPQVQRLSQDPAAGPKTGVAVPVVIEGSLDNPTYRPDVGAVLQDAIKDPEKFKEQLKNTRGTLKDQLQDPKKAVKDIKGLLKGL